MAVNLVIKQPIQGLIPLLIRPATFADIPDLLELARQTPTAAHWGQSTYEAALAGKSLRTILVAEEDGRINGFVVAQIAVSEWEVENIVVAEGARRSGLGTQLLRGLLEEAHRDGADAVLLEVRESNSGARALYARAGFLESGRRKSYYRNPEEDAILYRLDHP